jgi:hypothetical protein
MHPIWFRKYVIHVGACSLSDLIALMSSLHLILNVRPVLPKYFYCSLQKLTDISVVLIRVFLVVWFSNVT